MMSDKRNFVVLFHKNVFENAAILFISKIVGIRQ